jgi:hypothetical protein
LQPRSCTWDHQLGAHGRGSSPAGSPRRRASPPGTTGSASRCRRCPPRVRPAAVSEGPAMWSTVSPWAIRVVGFLYAFFAILSMPVLVYWSLAVPSALREPSSEALTFLAIFTMMLTISLAAGVASWGLRASALGSRRGPRRQRPRGGSDPLRGLLRPPCDVARAGAARRGAPVPGRGLGVAAARRLRRLASRRLREDDRLIQRYGARPGRLAGARFNSAEPIWTRVTTTIPV